MVIEPLLIMTIISSGSKIIASDGSLEPMFITVSLVVFNH
jgi:hypothetical protein